MSLFFSHFTVTILAIGRTPLYDRQRTLLKPSTDTRELLYAVKIPQNGNVGAINDSKLQIFLNILYFFTVLRVYTVFRQQSCKRSLIMNVIRLIA